MFSIRLIQEDDLASRCGLDAVAQQVVRRRDLIARAAPNGDCHVAIDTQVLGYGMLECTFFENGFVSMLYVYPDSQRHGVGLKLMHHLETTCQTPKLFTSTNLSNLPMQSLLAKLTYRLSGIIHDLDAGDPELVCANT